MPRKKVNRKKRKDHDDTESESGKLSETQEVAKRLSRTRLGKENASRPHHVNLKKTKKGPLDPYDADSEVESDINIQTDTDRSPMTPMITDNIPETLPSNPRLTALNPQLSLFHQDHSTPSTITPGRSDDSLYGFGAVLNSPLPFSPVSATPSGLPSSPSGSVFSMTSSMSTTISPGKRKLNLRVFDMPIEKPSKKAKKKKTKLGKEIPQNEVSQVLGDFEEVEMFDLIIE
ncbi:uncharacterized protein LOC116305491 [Actinia tenebrosa]|uniref:Uncharacterized protein LOC116305491 n=1 Tax=Actinia tenebrosa TaxID=6105 RepID=A0A6P8IVZ4_ACTTE|nr:uncharacterized protein LOC116305491 [Actinia tenebrosa]